MKRERWQSKLGIILAVAGSAVGLGNFLRFPVQAVQNGGGAFMIPYFVSFLLLGIPLCWVEWAMGRYGGQFSHGSAPGIFNAMVKHPAAKYLGSIGLFGPLVIFFYYIYVESWTLGYSFFSIAGKYASANDAGTMKTLLSSYQGLGQGAGQGIGTAYIFYLLTFAVNFYIIYLGVVKGIEVLSKIAMPILAVVGIILAARILFLDVQVPAHPDWNIKNALGFFWNPNLGSLRSAKVWLAAAGQIFFTLSIGIGVILTYASYLSKKDDITLSGLTSASTNEFFEVIVGGSIIIPAAYMFFGPAGTTEVAKSGSFNLGFVTMPLIFQNLPYPRLFGSCWFLLLFLAGVTSSISLLQPVISFLEDDFGLSRKKSVAALAALCFIFTQPVIFFLGRGVLDEMDFWGGSFLLVLFAAIEVIIFAWIFGIDRAWEELHLGADIKIPRFYKFIIKYITPVFLLVILCAWIYQQVIPTVLMRGIPRQNLFYIIGTRVMLAILLCGLLYLIRLKWKRSRTI